MVQIVRAPHPWILSDPIRSVQKFERQALAWNVLSKITVAAIAAICFSVLVASFALGSTTGALPFVLFGLMLSTPFLAERASKFQTKAKECGAQAEVARSIEEKYKTLQNWHEDHIRGFLVNHGVVPPVDFPLRSLLPLIARFKARVQEAKEEKQASDRMLQADIPAEKKKKLGLSE